MQNELVTSTQGRPGVRRGRNENRNESWYLDLRRESHNRRPGSMAWRKHSRWRSRRREWRRRLRDMAGYFVTVVDRAAGARSPNGVVA